MITIVIITNKIAGQACNKRGNLLCSVTYRQFLVFSDKGNIVQQIKSIVQSCRLQLNDLQWTTVSDISISLTCGLVGKVLKFPQTKSSFKNCHYTRALSSCLFLTFACSGHCKSCYFLLNTEISHLPLRKLGNSKLHQILH